MEQALEFVNDGPEDEVVVCPACDGDGMDQTGRFCCKKCDGYSLLLHGKPYKE